MAKIYVLSTLVNKRENQEITNKEKAIKVDNKIIFKENGIKVEIVMKKNAIYMKRITEEGIYEFNFQKKDSYCDCYVPSLNQKFRFMIKLHDLKITKQEFQIDYELEENQFHMKVKLEEIV